VIGLAVLLKTRVENPFVRQAVLENADAAVEALRLGSNRPTAQDDDPAVRLVSIEEACPVGILRAQIGQELVPHRVVEGL
jgi:hypothetical protein